MRAGTYWIIVHISLTFSQSLARLVDLHHDACRVFFFNLLGHGGVIFVVAIYYFGLLTIAVRRYKVKIDCDEQFGITSPDQHLHFSLPKNRVDKFFPIFYYLLSNIMKVVWSIVEKLGQVFVD